MHVAIASRAALTLSLLVLCPVSGGFNWRGLFGRKSKPTSPNPAISTESQSCAFGRVGCGEPPGGFPTKPRTGEFVVDPLEYLSNEALFDISEDLAEFNSTSGGYRCYLVVVPELPPVPSARDVARQLLRDWFGQAPGAEKHLIILMVAATNRLEVGTGGRVRRRLKDSAIRRIGRKVQQQMIAGRFDAAAKLAVKEVTKAASSTQGKFGSLKSVLMPLMVIGGLAVMCETHIEPP